MSFNINKIWENQIYIGGKQINKYPDHTIIPLLMSVPEKQRSGMRVLEVGCGAGNNLWMAAREGFFVFGVDISLTAINYAKKRFSDDGLTGEFIVGDCEELMWEDNTFHIVIDRAAITHNDFTKASRIIGEVSRVMKPNAVFRSVIFSDRYSTISGKCIGRKSYTDFAEGMFVGHGTVLMLDIDDIVELMACKGLSVSNYYLHDEKDKKGNIVNSYWVVDSKPVEVPCR